MPRLECNKHIKNGNYDDKEGILLQETNSYNIQKFHPHKNFATSSVNNPLRLQAPMKNKELQELRSL